MSKLPVSVLMITLNEEANLPGALDSVKDLAQEVFIVDSCSMDKTIDIALEYGVHVVQRRFTNFGDQWNWALQNLPVSTPWSFVLAPDERISEGLQASMRRLFEGTPDCNGYSMDRRLWFMGKPLHVTSPELRLWRTGLCRYSDVIVNEHPIVPQPLGHLKGITEHLDSPDLHHWWEKQNRYSTMEAISAVRGDQLAAAPRLLGSSLERRMFLKKIFFKVPFRYQIAMLHGLFYRGAWRDGKAGFAWARLRVEVLRMRELKTIEMRTTGRIPAIPKAPRGDFDPRVKHYMDNCGCC